mmetsp:Transcript_48134/g.35321  ORF Transcript_48134/g.35321 Transcript_48134/m.35321 type:complete len:104 (+) Transcript_48134:189-500(+)
MRTWKQKMTANRNHFFVKDHEGYLQPIFMQTKPNIANSQQMVLILEQDKEFNPFLDSDGSKNVVFLLTDLDFNIKELSKNFERITGIGYKGLEVYQENFERCL